MLFPTKATLTLAALAALALVPNLWPNPFWQGLDIHEVPAVWNMPIPSLAHADNGPSMEQVRANRMDVAAQTYLADPNHTLDAFYDALLKGGTTRILHYGDSPTTADLITSDARSLLQQQFGDAGEGFVLIAKPWAWYKHRGIEMTGSGWTIRVAGVAQLSDSFYGLGAASFQGSAGAVSHWTLPDRSHASAEVYYLAVPGGGEFSLEADGAALGSKSTAGEGSEPGFASFDLPQSTRNVTLKVTEGSVRLYGIDFRRASPGVVYTAAGVNGANITLISRAMSASHWTTELNHYKPDLLILGYGTNESGFPDFVKGTWAAELRLAIKKARAALPGVPILLMSPMDRGAKNKEGEIETIAAMPTLIELEEKVAKETGVAWFDTFDAMGGSGTMARWYAAEPRMVGADFIHPLPSGAKIVGELLYKALRNGFQNYKLRQLSGGK